MADSLLDLGTTDLYYPENLVNWRKAPVIDFDLAKKIHEYTGTVQEFLLVSENTPRKWDFEVLNPDKQTEYDLLETFLYTYQARKKRFWFPLPVTLFYLSQFIPGSSTTVNVKDNGMDYQGFERFFIELWNGDKITRKITNVERFPVTKTLALTVSAMPASPIYEADIKHFTFLPLCRFDQDVIKMKFSSSSVSVCNIKMQELLEHSEA